MDKDRPKLNLRQQKFVVEYLKNGGNGRQAAIKAGYSKKTAVVQGSRLLTNDAVLSLLAKPSKRLQMNIEKIRLRIEQRADLDIRKAISWTKKGGVELKDSADIDEDTIRAIAGVKNVYDKDGKLQGVDVIFHDVKEAQSLLVKLEGMDKSVGEKGVDFTQNNLFIQAKDLTMEQIKGMMAILEDPKLAPLKPLVAAIIQGKAHPKLVEQANELK
jgi:phage terminase small subunit